MSRTIAFTTTRRAPGAPVPRLRWPGRAIAIGFLAGLLLGPPGARAADPFDAEGDPRFRVEWRPSTGFRAGTSLEGYVYNNDIYRVGLVQLRVEVLDENGQVVSTGRGWVYGDIPAGGRASFVVRPPSAGARYRITIASFARISRGDAP